VPTHSRRLPRTMAVAPPRKGVGMEN